MKYFCHGGLQEKYFLYGGLLSKYFCHGGLLEKYFLYGGLLRLLLSQLCLTMEDASGCPFIHRVTDKSFDTLFSKKGKNTDEKYWKALETLGISNIVNYTSCEDNIANLRKKGTLSQLLRGPYSGSVVVDVPPKGESAVLRGRKNGDMKKIASEAPHIHKCDIGGDSLHHVANSFKKAAEKIFTRINNILNNIKYEIRSSPAKVDDYIAACLEVGDHPTMVATFCISRWLDR